MVEPVSCIMATRNRENFLRAALRYFNRQTYADCVLLVLDDSDRSLEHVCAGCPRLKYMRMAPGTPLGTKLNEGIRATNSNLILKLDDDDYYDPRFVERAVRAIDGFDIVAWDCYLVWIRARNELHYSGHGWAAGGTLLFRRSVWEATPFRSIPSGVDFHFLRDHSAARLNTICEPELYIAIRHEAHTWRWFGQIKIDDFYQNCPKYNKTLAELLDPDDLAFYRSLPPTASLFRRITSRFADRFLVRRS